MPAAPSALTLNYDAILSTTLFNYQKELADQISTSNALLYYIMKVQQEAYVSEDNIGDRAQIPLMYALNDADFFSGYDVINPTPIDGITSAFYNWAQLATSITISGIEEKKNSSEAAILNLLESKTKQSVMGIQTLFNRALLQGNGVNVASQITTAYTSPNNGALGIDPLPLAVKFDPTTTAYGNINPATYSWWQNKFYGAQAGTGSGSPTPAVTTFVGFLKALRHLRNECSKGPGGVPNLFVATQGSVELYEAALAAAHRNPSYQVADIPFDNVGFYGKPMVWDEFVPDAQSGSTSLTYGSVYMLNTEFIKVKYHSGSNFVSTPFQRPVNQDAKTAMILWVGALLTSNRRKHGVMGGIDHTIAS